jgi:hypothetical protein
MHFQMWRANLVLAFHIRTRFYFMQVQISLEFVSIPQVFIVMMPDSCTETQGLCRIFSWACIMFAISVCLPFYCDVLMWQSRKQKVGEKPLLARSTFIQVIILSFSFWFTCKCKHILLSYVQLLLIASYCFFSHTIWLSTIHQLVL